MQIISLAKEQYMEIGRYVHRMKSVVELVRKEQIQEAKNTFPKQILQDMLELEDFMYMDEEIFQIAGLRYSEDPLGGSNLFRSAIADYFLKHKKLLEPKPLC